MSEHDVVEHLQQAQHSTAQRNQPGTKQQRKYYTCPSERDNARKQTIVDESQHVVEHLYSSLCPLNERRNPSLPGLQKYRNCVPAFESYDGSIITDFSRASLPLANIAT